MASSAEELLVRVKLGKEVFFTGAVEEIVTRRAACLQIFFGGERQYHSKLA
jgi:hypothetical protein